MVAKLGIESTITIFIPIFTAILVGLFVRTLEGAAVKLTGID